MIRALLTGLSSASGLLRGVAVTAITVLAIWVLCLRAELAICKGEHARAQADAVAAALTATTAAAEQMALTDAIHEEELEHARQAAENLRADLADSRQRLRQRFTCPRLPGAATAPGQTDEAAGLRPEDAAFLVGASEACDADIRALQAIILNDRKICR